MTNCYIKPINPVIPIIMIQSLNAIENKTYHLIPAKHEAKIYANARFGIPSQNCVGLGICSIELLSSIYETPAITCNCDNGNCSIQDLGDDRLCFQFLKSDLSSEAQAKHFGNPIFVIEEDYVLPKSITRILGYSKTLKAGGYPIIDEKENYTVFL